MAQVIRNFLGIKTAALTIAYDNGMINRETSEEDFLDRCDAVIGADGVDLHDLLKINDYLCSLSDEQMNDLCCGEQPQDVLLDAFQTISGLDREILNGLLNDLFEV